MMMKTIKCQVKLFKVCSFGWTKSTQTRTLYILLLPA